ncbi:MAG: hypothetical protein NTX50_12215 [Candidatus Sumerlaeota bacterium]|nr:hypothetical protein [Candidatus Sumerlaeota bacterium]
MTPTLSDKFGAGYTPRWNQHWERRHPCRRVSQLRSALEPAPTEVGTTNELPAPTEVGTTNELPAPTEVGTTNELPAPWNYERTTSAN